VPISRRFDSGIGSVADPRWLAVLHMLSHGRRTKETAELLELSEETVRSHVKKAIAKLGVRNVVQAVAQSLRLRLIP
jgi:LuxR family quorum sensing-dependent transcriptional regulator